MSAHAGLKPGTHLKFVAPTSTRYQVWNIELSSNVDAHVSVEPDDVGVIIGKCPKPDHEDCAGYVVRFPRGVLNIVLPVNTFQILELADPMPLKPRRRLQLA